MKPRRPAYIFSPFEVNDMTETSTTDAGNGSPLPATRWKQLVAQFQTPCTGRATWQIINTFVPFVALWVFMYWALTISFWLAVPAAVLAGGFVVRIFIIFHDCGHGSFFKSRIANHILGFISGLFTFTPYFHWRWEHSLHHASSGDLDRRGVGDIWTMTVAEYMASSRWRRFAYRLARNPIILFGLGPLYLFLIQHRLPARKANFRERFSVWCMNLVILLFMAGMAAIFGLANYILLQLIVLLVAGAAGVWLFYVQHQFEDVYWERGEQWDYAAAALQGSSFYKLPRILQWFSGNIGFHHIHHLSPRIPNYNLERCHNSDPLFREVKPITLLASLKTATYRLWDEQQRRLVGWDRVRELRRAASQAVDKLNPRQPSV
jgi:acyl-lipid omega-6 desaturase (Delta-12 desaturase)